MNSRDFPDEPGLPVEDGARSESLEAVGPRHRRGPRGPLALHARSAHVARPTASPVVRVTEQMPVLLRAPGLRGRVGLRELADGHRVPHGQEYLVAPATARHVKVYLAGEDGPLLEPGSGMFMRPSRCSPSILGGV